MTAHRYAYVSPEVGEAAVWLPAGLAVPPILIAVVTALLTMEGVKYLVTIRKQSRTAAANQTASPNGPSTKG